MKMSGEKAIHRQELERGLQDIKFYNKLIYYILYNV